MVEAVEQAAIVTRLGRPALTREAVVSAARGIIVREGHEALSLRHLARQLGVTAAAFYAYVDDKLDLLRAVAAQEYEHRVAHYEAIDEPNPLDRLRRISHAYVDYARNNPELFRLTLLFPPIGGGTEDSDELRYGRRAFDIAADAVEESIAQGLLRDGDSFLMSLTIWTAVHGAASFVLQGAEFVHGREKELVSSVVENVLAGLAMPQDNIGSDQS